jgi:hypothetical protein
LAQLVERVAAARGGGACPLRTGQLGAAVMAGARPIHHLCALMDERCTCKRPERERPHRVASCLPRVCTGARVSLVQWQDWRSGGRDLRSATRGGACVGVRERLIAGGEKKGEG